MTVLHYLERVAREFPDKTAISDEHGCFTFSKLRESALSIAGHITKKLNGETHRSILVYLPKNKECIVAFMGIIYSRNIYTPTDIRYPFSKVQGVIDVLEPTLYISNQQNTQKLRDNNISDENILVYDEMISRGAEFDANIAMRDIIDTDPVYVIFTSGSTGVPKGVTISHRSICDYIDWAAECFTISEREIIGNQAPLHFDNSVLDIYLSLKTGAQMHIIPESLFAFPVKLIEYLVEYGINFIFWVPSALCHIANKGVLDSAMLPKLKKILFAGEVMPNKQLNYWRSYFPDAVFANLYGPTEITVDCIYYIIDREFNDNEPLPLGAPCKNTDILLIDAHSNLVTEPEVQGEICVRGSSLSHGYWNNPQKTDKVFVQNPFNPHYPEKIYRTGDLAHYNDRGEFMFDGRKDFQIKHLGYRIELGEIEIAAASIQGVKVVSADYDSINQEIALFFEGSIEERLLHKNLLKILPKYMVPARYIRLDEFSYNDNGKIDRKKLWEKYIMLGR